MTAEPASTTHGRRGLPHHPALDGLRGVAVLAVLAFHAGFGWARGGFLGVSTFFTLSGFLITSLLLAEHERTARIDLRAFWARRARRLLPAAWLALLGITLYGAVVADPSQLHRLRGDVLAALSYVANWRFVVTDESYAALFTSPSPVLHFWSLAIEEQYYLLYPLVAVVALHGRVDRARRLGIVLVVALGASLTATAVAVARGAGDDRIYYGTDTRIAELLVGALLAVALQRRALDGGRRSRIVDRLAPAALLATGVAYGMVTLDSGLAHRGGLPVFAVVSAVVIAGATRPSSLTGRMLALPPLRAVGRISYGLYLFHWPVFLWLMADHGWTEWRLLLGGGALTVALATASYLAVEQPIRHGHAVARRTAWLLVPATTLVVGAAAVAVTRDLPDDPVAILREVESRPRPPPTNVPDDGRVRVMVVGDSVSWYIGHGLELWANDEADVVAWNLGTLGCGVARGGDVRLSTSVEPSDPKCATWEERWSSEVARLEPDVVVVLTGLWDFTDRRLPGWDDFLSIGDPTYDRYLLDEYAAAVDALTAHGAEIVWLSAPCYAEWILPGPLADTGALEPSRRRHYNDIILPMLVEEHDAHITLVDLESVACPDGELTQTLGPSDIARPDGVHFSVDAARWVAGRIGPEIVRAAGESGGSSGVEALLEPADE